MLPYRECLNVSISANGICPVTDFICPGMVCTVIRHIYLLPCEASLKVSFSADGIRPDVTGLTALEWFVLLTKQG